MWTSGHIGRLHHQNKNLVSGTHFLNQQVKTIFLKVMLVFTTMLNGEKIINSKRTISYLGAF